VFEKIRKRFGKGPGPVMDAMAQRLPNNGKLPFEPQKIRKGIQYGNMAIYVAAVVASILVWFNDATYINVLCAIFEICFCAVLLVVESGSLKTKPEYLKSLKNDVGFLFRPMGRLLFVLYLALMLFAFGILGIVVGSFMLLLALFNAYIWRIHPEVFDGYGELPPAGADVDVDYNDIGQLPPAGGYENPTMGQI